MNIYELEWMEGFLVILNSSIENLYAGNSFVSMYRISYINNQLKYTRGLSEIKNTYNYETQPLRTLFL